MRRRVFSVVVIGVVFAAAFSSSQHPSSGQQQLPPTNRKPACTIFCGSANPNPNYFWLFTREQQRAGQCYGGPLPPDQANNFYNELTEDQRKAVCANLKAANQRTTECPAFKRLAWLCGQNEPPKKECEKPVPWFGTPPPGCKDVQNPVAAINAGAVTLSICGVSIFRWEPSGDYANDPLVLEAYKNLLESEVEQRVGTKVCCDKFREAARTGMPCDPRADVDCDGRPNQQDIRRDNPPEGQSLLSGIPYPSIDRVFSTPEDASIDPFPPGLNPDDTDFFPPRDKCDCKWELVKGTLTCSADGRQPHSYQARWRCPSTGNERFTRKEAAASAPCTPPQR